MQARRRVEDQAEGRAKTHGSKIKPLDNLTRGERPNWRALPEPLDTAEVLYANKRPEIDNRTPGELMLWLFDTRAYQEILAPALDEVEAEWERARRGQEARWTSHQLEVPFLLRYFSGKLSLAQARVALTGQDGMALRAVLYRNPKSYTGGPEPRYDISVPPPAALSRHRRRLPDERRRELYKQLFERLVVEHIEEFEEFREECRVLQMDGTLMATSHVTPIWEKEGKGTGENGERLCLNADKVTCWDGGFIPKTKKYQAHSGSGFGHIGLVSGRALPLAIEVAPYHESEGVVGLRAVQSFAEKVRPHLDPDKLCVLTADCGFNNLQLRVAARGAGVVENIHARSHKDTEKNVRSIKKLDGKRWEIEGYPKWKSNALRELHCTCGKGKTYRKLAVRNGRAVVRTEGRCATCGPCNITSGEWRRAKNPNRFVRRQPGDPIESIDWTMGNPLTYNDLAAGIYGSDRFGTGESYNHSLKSDRFGIARKAPRRIATRQQAEIDAYGVAIAMHVMAMGCRRLLAGQPATATPAPAPPPRPPRSLVPAP